MSDGQRPGCEACRGSHARARRVRAFVLAAILALLSTAPALAVPWKDPAAPSQAPHERRVDYLVKDQSLTETLAILAMVTGIPIAVTGKVEGRVRSARLTGTLGAVLDKLSSEFGFFYASDGVRFTVQARDSSTVSIVEVAKVRHPGALKLLASLFPALSEGSVDSRPDLGVVVLRGPAEFVDTAKTVLARTDDAAPDKFLVFRFGMLRVEHPE